MDSSKRDAIINIFDDCADFLKNSLPTLNIALPASIQNQNDRILANINTCRSLLSLPPSEKHSGVSIKSVLLGKQTKKKNEVISSGVYEEEDFECESEYNAPLDTDAATQIVRPIGISSIKPETTNYETSVKSGYLHVKWVSGGIMKKFSPYQQKWCVLTTESFILHEKNSLVRETLNLSDLKLKKYGNDLTGKMKFTLSLGQSKIWKFKALTEQDATAWVKEICCHVLPLSASSSVPVLSSGDSNETENTSGQIYEDLESNVPPSFLAGNSSKKSIFYDEVVDKIESMIGKPQDKIDCLEAEGFYCEPPSSLPITQSCIDSGMDDSQTYDTCGGIIAQPTNGYPLPSMFLPPLDISNVISKVKDGSVPENDVYYALHRFHHTRNYELDLSPGDILRIFDNETFNKNGWWVAENKGRLGLVPASFLGRAIQFS